MYFRLTANNRRRALSFARWALPAVASVLVSGFVAWGSIQYAKGSDAHKLETAERDVRALREEQKEFVRRDAFQIVLDDLKEIKGDVRALRARAHVASETPPTQTAWRGQMSGYGINQEGNLTLIKGDCLEAMRGLPANSVDACITDPPYGTTNCKWDSVIPFEPMWRELTRVVKPDGAIVLFAGQPFTSRLICSNLRLYKYSWVWEKAGATGFLNAKKQPLRAFEDICVFYRKQPTYNPVLTPGKPYRVKRQNHGSENYREFGPTETVNTGFRYPRNVLRFPNNNHQGKAHPTQKPLALLQYLVSTYTNAGDTVLDFTMGSGTTGEACALLGRGFIGVEREGRYFEPASRRIVGAWPRAEAAERAAA